MTLDEAVKFFGSGNALCEAIGVARQNYTVWKRIGYIRPLAQFKIEKITDGALKADWKEVGR